MMRHRLRTLAKTLCVHGVTADKVVHLKHLGLNVDEDVDDGHFVLHLASVDGHAPGSDGHVARVEDRLLAGLHDHGTTRIREIGLHLFRTVRRGDAGACGTGIDVVTREILAGHGISPAWIVLLTAVSRSFIVTDPSGSPVIRIETLDCDDEAPLITPTIHLGGGARWTGEGVLVPGLPETIRHEMPGRPLRDVVSHPVLDRHAFTITELRGAQIDVGHVPYDPVDWSCGFMLRKDSPR